MTLEVLPGRGRNVALAETTVGFVIQLHANVFSVGVHMSLAFRGTDSVLDLRLVVSKALLYVPIHVKRVTRDLWNSQATIESDNSGQCPKTDNNSPHAVNSITAGGSLATAISLALVVQIVRHMFYMRLPSHICQRAKEELAEERASRCDHLY